MTKTQLKAIATALTILAASSPAIAQETDVPTQLVDVFNKLFGVHPGFRANHAKGVVVEGSFTASPDAAGAEQGRDLHRRENPRHRALLRLDRRARTSRTATPNANPHGISIKYPSAGRQRHRHGDQFAAFLPGRDRRGLPSPCSPRFRKARRMRLTRRRSRQFVSTHPSVPAALATVHTPDSFADEEYFGINAFVFVNKDGARAGGALSDRA